MFGSICILIFSPFYWGCRLVIFFFQRLFCLFRHISFLTVCKNAGQYDTMMVIDLDDDYCDDGGGSGIGGGEGGDVDVVVVVMTKAV